MYPLPGPLQAVDGGLLGTVSQAAVLAGTLVLILALVALGAFAYREVLGDGVEWPDDEDGDEGAEPGDADDEWKYY